MKLFWIERPTTRDPLKNACGDFYLPFRKRSCSCYVHRPWVLPSRWAVVAFLDLEELVAFLGFGIFC